MTLFWRRFREESRSLLTWSLSVGLLSVAMLMIVLMFGNLKEMAELLDRALADLPPVLRSMFGEGSLMDPVLFAQTLLFGTVAPIVMMVFASMAVSGIYTRDAGNGNLEFLFSLPVKRFSLVASKAGVFVINLALLHVILFVAAWVGSGLSGSDTNLRAFFAAAANAFLLNACISGLVFNISLFLNDYSRCILVALGAQFGLFLLNMGIENRGGFVSKLNPYYYYQVEQLMNNAGFPWVNSAILATAAMALWSAGIYAYIRKQV